MPLCDGEEHQLRQALPSSVKGPADELLLLRFTGEVFDNYEDYIKALNLYRQRIWSCKYTGQPGLTYEEAVANEYKTLQVISQFPANAEEAAAKLVHHSLDPLEVLKATIIELGGSTKITPELATQWIYSVATPQPVAGVPGVECIWKLYDHFRVKYNLSEDLPPALAERIRPVRQSKHAGAATAAAAVHVDANGNTRSANGRNRASGALLEGGDIEDPLLEGDLADGAAAAGDDDGNGDLADDEYKPSRFSVEDLPWRARGRGRGNAASRGAAAGGRGRGRGRGRKSAAGAAEDEMEQPAAGSAGLHPNALVSGSDAVAAAEAAGLKTTTSPLDATTAATATTAAATALQPSDADLQMMVESLEDVERRLQPGSIKHGVLTLLKEAGAAGMTIIDLATAMMARGLKQWDEVRQARNSIASTCGHDSAFVRVAPGKFALRCLVPITQLTSVAGPLPTAQRDNLGEAASRQLAAVEAAQAEAMRKLAEQKAKKGQLEKNNFKCPKCHRIAHAELSPLILCDTCPRSYHVACLGLQLHELPTGDWCCPKCVENTQAVLRRVMDLEAKKKEALERAVTKDKAAEDKLLRRLLAKEGKDAGGSASRLRGGQAGGGAGGGGAGGGNLASALKDGGVNRQLRRVLDDWDVLEEEKKHLSKLELRVKELQKLASGSGGAGGDVMMAEQPSSLARAGSFASLPGSSFNGGDDTLALRATQAVEALEKLKLIILGPPATGFPPLLSDPSATAALAEASTVSEFLHLYGAVCELDRDLTTTELVSAAAWPLDAATELSPLYRQLLLCCLLEQMNRDPPIRGRSRRWFATLTDATWPEVLRRYLLATRITDVESQKRKRDDDGGGGGNGDNENGGGGSGDDDDDDEDEDEDDVKGTTDTLAPGRKSRNQSQLDLLTSQQTSYSEPLYDINPLEMDDKQLAIHCAALLSRGGWWELPAVCHLRLLGMLCYDIAQGQNLREDINTRAVDCTKVQADWVKEVAAERRKQQKRGAAGGADGDGGANKKRKSGGIGGGGKKESVSNLLLADGTTNNDPEGINGDGGQDTGGEDPLRTGLSSAREAEFEAELAQRAYRTDPLGFDRHSHRYWWLRGNPSHIQVENLDGSSAGVITTVEQLDDLISKLNVRGPREYELHLNLRKKYQDIVAAFEEHENGTLEEEVLERQEEKEGRKSSTTTTTTTTPAAAVLYDVFKLPRPTPTDGRIKVKDLPVLAAGVTTAAVVDAKEQLDSFINETEEMGLVFAGDLKSFKRELKSVETPMDLCDFLLNIERYYATASEGLPLGAKNDELGMLLSEEEVQLLPELIGLPPPVAADEEEDEDEGDKEADEEAAEKEEEAVKKEEQGAAAADPMETDNKVKNEASNGSSDKEEDGEEEEENQRKASGGPGAWSTRGAITAAAAAPLRPVALNDEFDDSDAEHQFLREKRMRRPARLWRSPRERAVWLKLVLNAKKAAGDNIMNAGAQAAYCTYMMYDRGNKLLKIAAKLAEDTAKWEEAEAARAKAEAERNGEDGAGGAGGGGSGGGSAAAAAERPLMIRTGKFKSKDGMRIILKCMGKEPFPAGRQSLTDGTTITEDMVDQCRWGYQCGVCMLAGDLLCCEHPDGCAVSVHPACIGLPFPQGQWICGNHEDRRVKGRNRRQGRVSAGGDYETLSDLTESEEDEAEKNSEEDSDANVSDGEGNGGEKNGGGGRRQSIRRRS